MILIRLPSKESGLWLRASHSISVSTVSWCILAIITHGLCFTMGPMRWARSTFMPRGKLASPKSEGNRPETNCVGLPFLMFSGRPAILIICPQDLASKSVTLDFRDAFSCDKLEQSCSRWEMHRLYSVLASSKSVIWDVLAATADCPPDREASKSLNQTFMKLSIFLMAKRITLGETSSSPSRGWETLVSVVSLTQLAWPQVLASADAELARVPSTVSLMRTEPFWQSF